MSIKPLSLRPRAASDVLWLLLLGAGAGFLNGLLGAAGGVLLIFFLGRHHTSHSNDFFLSPRDVYATALCVILPLSLLSALRYAAAGTLSVQDFIPLALPSLIGGLFGAYLLDRLPLFWVRRLFGGLLLCSGIVMLVRT